MVGQIWVYGNSFKSFIVAVVVPDAQVLVAKFKEVCDANKDMVKKLVVDDMKLYEKELLRFERVKDVCFEFELDDLLQGFNVENNLMTPTFKKKRPQLTARYVEDVKKLYADNGEPPHDDENW